MENVTAVLEAMKVMSTLPSDSMQRMVFKVVLSSVAFFGQSSSIDPSSFLFFTVSVRVPMNFLKDDGKNDRAPQVSNPIVANSVCKLLPFRKLSIEELIFENVIIDQLLTTFCPKAQLNTSQCFCAAFECNR